MSTLLCVSVVVAGVVVVVAVIELVVEGGIQAEYLVIVAKVPCGVIVATVVSGVVNVVVVGLVFQIITVVQQEVLFEVGWLGGQGGGLGRLALGQLPLGTVLVVRVKFHVVCPQALGLVDKGALVACLQALPLHAQALGDLGVVHLGVFDCHLFSLLPRPHHEGVHRPFDLQVHH